MNGCSRRKTFKRRRILLEVEKCYIASSFPPCFLSLPSSSSFSSTPCNTVLSLQFCELYILYFTLVIIVSVLWAGLQFLTHLLNTPFSSFPSPNFREFLNKQPKLHP